MATDKIRTANEKVTIFHVLRQLGIQVEDSWSKTKVWCPFGSMYHEDGGRKRSFQVYPDTNTATCLSGCGYFHPTTLWAQAKDCEPQQAAEALLDQIGWKEPTLDRRWELAIAGTETYVGTKTLGAALIKYCARVDPNWEFDQFEQPVSDKLQQCLALLEHVITEEQAETWISKTKAAMAQTLGVEDETE